MRRWTAGLYAAVFLVGADVLLWWGGVRQLDAGVNRWTGMVATQGWTVSAGTRQSGGWPFVASLAMPSLQVTGGERLMPGGVAWHAARVVLSVSLLHPGTLVIAADGLQVLRLSHAPSVVFTAAQLVGTLPLWGGHHAEVGCVSASGVVGGIAGSNHPQDVRVASVRLVATRLKDDAAAAWPAASLDVAASGIGLPDIGRWPLGATVAGIGASLLLDSPPRAGLAEQVGGTGSGETPATAATPADQAQAWRDGGGKLKASNVYLHWGPLALTATAELGLDPDLQPAGSGSADVTGSAAALDALAGGGVIAPGLAATGQAVLTLMAPAGAGAVRLPFVLRDSTLSIGQIPVIRLSRVSWKRRAAEH